MLWLFCSYYMTPNGDIHYVEPQLSPSVLGPIRGGISNTGVFRYKTRVQFLTIEATRCVMELSIYTLVGLQE
jgi:hypothetical protein